MVRILLRPEISRVLGRSPPFDLDIILGRRKKGPRGLVTGGLSPLVFCAVAVSTKNKTNVRNANGIHECLMMEAICPERVFK